MTPVQRTDYWLKMGDDAVGMSCRCALERYVVAEVRPIRQELMLRDRKGGTYTVSMWFAEPLLDENRPG